LGDLRDPRAVPILVPLLKDQDVNYIVPWSLGEIGDRSAIPPLIETLNDKNPDMRVLAIYALVKLKAKEALPRIRAMVNDNERIHFDGLGTVAEAARAAIVELAGSRLSIWHPLNDDAVLFIYIWTFACGMLGGAGAFCILGRNRIGYYLAFFAVFIAVIGVISCATGYAPWDWWRCLTNYQQQGGLAHL
jgi:hypothetical protein